LGCPLKAVLPWLCQNSIKHLNNYWQSQHHAPPTALLVPNIGSRLESKDMFLTKAHFFKYTFPLNKIVIQKTTFALFALCPKRHVTLAVPKFNQQSNYILAKPTPRTSNGITCPECREPIRAY
jgi:hypothetical protein